MSREPGNSPATQWLGYYAPSEKVRASGLWNVQHTCAAARGELDLERLEALVTRSAARWSLEAKKYETLVIVPCGRAKIWDRNPQHGPAQAPDAYTGQPARAHRRYAQCVGDAWLVLSAKYGLIQPWFAIPGPYDVTFKTVSTAPIKQDVLKAQAQQLGVDRFTRTVVLGGADYVNALREPLDQIGVQWTAPFLGLRQGEQMSAVTHAVASSDPQI